MERIAPAGVEPLDFVAADPDVRPGALALLVGPPGDRHRALGVVREMRVRAALRKL